jgi:hypothetical protein
VPVVVGVVVLRMIRAVIVVFAVFVMRVVLAVVHCLSPGIKDFRISTEAPDLYYSARRSTGQYREFMTVLMPFSPGF